MASMVSIALLPGVADAHIVDFFFAMRGSQVVPPTDSSARGGGILSYNHHTFNYNLDLRITGVDLDDLLDAGPNGTPLHIYKGARGENGEIVLDPGLFGSFEQDGDGISLSLSEIRLGQDQGAFSSDLFENEEALFDGLLYIQLFTTNYPNGEIRGQLPRLGKNALFTQGLDSGHGYLGDPIPIPTPGPLALAGVVTIAALRRRPR